MLPRSLSVVVVTAAAPVAIVVSLVLGFDVVEHEASRALVHRDADFVGATTCQRCHPDQHATWDRTFHSSMTQYADPDSVVGVFDGRSVTFYGKSACVFRDGERFLMDLPAKGGGRRTAEVALTVGSRRYQQYFERIERREGVVMRRLPLLWHIEAKRWLHLNGVFLGSDDANWEKHTQNWNQNCIFCHNTGPRPGYLTGGSERELLASAERTFDSKVAVLGIACESCHGPGRAHVERYQGIATRYGDYLVADNDTRIVHPNKIDKERSVGVCGQCHGQRVPKPLQRYWEWRRTGPTFRSGDHLSDHVTPVRPDTPVGDDSGVFAARFWGDGTPRLTAYEYQGVTMSACYLKGSMTCGTCHSMHGDDVHGQVKPGMRTDRACLQCHAKIGNDIQAHTKHAPASSGSRCLECHMPRIVYGIVEAHRSHRIDVPDAARDVEHGRPNACTLCHLDKSPIWAGDKMRELWGESYRRPAKRPSGAPLTLPDASASLLAGDPVQRFVFARSAGRLDAPVAPADKAELRVVLQTTLLDAYPSIRWRAQKSLVALERELPLGIGQDLARWDHEGEIVARKEVAHRLLGSFARLGLGKLRQPARTTLLGPELRPNLKLMRSLLNLQSKSAISIGE